MEYTIDNIGEWVADLAEKPKVTQFHTYARVIRDKERQNAEQTILKEFDKNNTHHGTKNVTIIHDDIAIVEFTGNGGIHNGKTYYIPVVQHKSNSWWFTTFEGALLAALSLMKTGEVDAAKYAAKLLEVDM